MHKEKLYFLCFSPMPTTLAFFQCNPWGLIYNKSTNNGFKINKTQTPISDHKFCSMKTQASNTIGTMKLNSFPEFDFKDYLESKMKRVNKALDQIVPIQHPTRITEAMRYSLLGRAKRFRAIMCLASCELVGGDEAQAMPFACAIEMVNTMSVMLDDLPCMDNDDVRRGNPANHKVFGEETTILAGDSLLCLAFQHVAEKTKNVSSKRILKGIVELGWATGFDGMLGGGLMDLNCEGKEVSLEEVECIHMRKTGKLIEASMVCGAIMGGGSDGEIERLRRYGANIGLMYQVMNDILDLTKSSEELGKTTKKDLVSDKATYPKFMGIEGAKRCVDELVAKAMHELSCFDSVRASPLHYLTNYIVNQLN